MLDRFLAHLPMPYHSSILPLIFVDGAPCTLTIKAKSNQSQGPEATTFEGPTFLSHLWVLM